MEKVLILRTLAALFSGAAGVAGMVWMMNNWLIPMRHTAYKHSLILAFGLGLPLLFLLYGYAAGLSPVLLLPGLVLLGVLLVELRLRLKRSGLEGDRPVARSGPAASWLSPVTTRALNLIHYELAIPGWQGPDLTIAHVTDFHVDRNLPDRFYQDALEQANRTAPDLFFFTGDYVSHREYAPRLSAILPVARSRLGNFGILGNHDYWADPQEVACQVEQAGVHLLFNSSCRIQVGAGVGIVLTGVESPWNRSPWTPPITHPGDLLLALTHTADNIYSLSRAGVQAAFSGHYHAGQIRLPLYGALVIPSRYGRLFDHGHFVIGATHLFVSAGLGSSDPPFRIYCPPDILIVKIKGAPEQCYNTGR